MRPQDVPELTSETALEAVQALALVELMRQLGYRVAVTAGHSAWRCVFLGQGDDRIGLEECMNASGGFTLLEATRRAAERAWRETYDRAAELWELEEEEEEDAA